jgi:hypothetical protein
MGEMSSVAKPNEDNLRGGDGFKRTGTQVQLQAGLPTVGLAKVGAGGGSRTLFSCLGSTRDSRYTTPAGNRVPIPAKSRRVDKTALQSPPGLGAKRGSTAVGAHCTPDAGGGNQRPAEVRTPSDSGGRWDSSRSTEAITGRISLWVKQGDQIVSALYGKINEGFRLAPNSPKTCGISISYYLTLRLLTAIWSSPATAFSKIFPKAKPRMCRDLPWRLSSQKETYL